MTKESKIESKVAKTPRAKSKSLKPTSTEVKKALDVLSSLSVSSSKRVNKILKFTKIRYLNSNEQVIYQKNRMEIILLQSLLIVKTHLSICETKTCSQSAQEKSFEDLFPKVYDHFLNHDIYGPKLEEFSLKLLSVTKNLPPSK